MVCNMLVLVYAACSFAFWFVACCVMVVVCWCCLLLTSYCSLVCPVVCVVGCRLFCQVWLFVDCCCCLLLGGVPFIVLFAMSCSMFVVYVCLFAVVGWFAVSCSLSATVVVRCCVYNCGLFIVQVCCRLLCVGCCSLSFAVVVNECVVLCCLYD